MSGISLSLICAIPLFAQRGNKTMKYKTLIALLLACSPTLAFAQNLTVGSSVPAVGVEKHGEIVRQDNNINYQNGALRIYLARYASFKRLRDVAAQRDVCATDGHDHRREIPSRVTKPPPSSIKTMPFGAPDLCEIVRARQQKSFLGHLWCLMSLVSLPKPGGYKRNPLQS